MSIPDTALAPRLSRRSGSPAASDFRPDIQGLRTIAVGLVVLYHLWPRRLSGGYVGVDVFFVISGFLITSHIHREIAATGGLKVTRFWARRIRRLLPASLLVLVLSGLAVLLLTPSTTWAQTAREIGASALYVQNWQLAFSSVDYMALENVPTVAQHFWSLSVEEQFYAVWPVLILGLMLLARWRATSARRAILGGLSLIFVVSLIWSVVSTARDQPFAYMSTFTRVWEFAAGGIAALVLPRVGRSMPPFLATAGLVSIIASGYVLTEASMFPGWVAVFPVLGTVALLLAAPATLVGSLLGTRGMTFIGDISYSIYLVHWPIIVVLPHVTGHALRWSEKLGILVLTLGLAWLSKTYVEDPLRTSPLLARSPRRAFSFVLVAMALVVGSTASWSTALEHHEAKAKQLAAAQIAGGGDCLGPNALVGDTDCGSVAGDGPLVLPPATVLAEKDDAWLRACHQTLAQDELLDCVMGDTKGTKGTIALVGDSHASALVPMADALGKGRGWKVIVHTKSSCPATDAVRILPSETSTQRQESCTAYNAAVDKALMADRSISMVITSSFTRAYDWEGAGGAEGEGAAVAGFAARFERWREAGKKVVVIADVPATRGVSVPSCVARNADDPNECALPRSEAVVPDLAVRGAEAADATVVDLTDLFCDSKTCFAQIGNVIVYRDTSHLSAEYSAMLAPFVDQRLG